MRWPKPLQLLVLLHLILVIAGLAYFLGFFAREEAVVRMAVERQLALSRAERLAAELEQVERIAQFSILYGIHYQMAELVYVKAEEADLPPAVGFAVVAVESGFNARAYGDLGEIGLTQVRPPAASQVMPGLALEDLWDPAVNLEVGFRYLRWLLDLYDDFNLALLAYNRGPTTVSGLLSLNVDPQNGYVQRVQGVMY